MSKRIQRDVGDPNAGLSEAERAARMGLGATYDPVTKKPVGQFRAVALDMDGDGHISTAAKEAAGNDVAFDWDDSGYLKQVAWVQPNDAYLFLDRNLNGVVDSGKELFSNSLVSDDDKGVRGLAELGIKAINYGITNDEIDSASRNSDGGCSQISSKVLKSAQDDARHTEQGAGIKSETPDGAPLIVIAQVQGEAAVLGLWHDRCHAKNASKPSANESVWSQAA
jgi:YD repeat-containing protein